MPYAIEVLNAAAPAVLIRISNPMDPAAELRRLLTELDATMAGITGEVVYSIIDTSHMVINVADIAAALATAYQPGNETEMPNLFNRRVIPVLIGSGALLMLLLRKVRQNRAGRPRMQMFTTLDEALAHITQTHAVEEK